MSCLYMMLKALQIKFVLICKQAKFYLPLKNFTAILTQVKPVIESQYLPVLVKMC